MVRLSFVVGAIFATFLATAFAGEPPQQAASEHALTKATYIVTGLHCQGCTGTVEASLQRVKGIRSIKVDWKTKNARAEFDEAVLPAQTLARLIAETPHMMGGNMHYGGWLVLNVVQIKDDASAQAAQGALSKVKGVERVQAYPAQHAIGVQFAKKGDATTKQLIEALKNAGLSTTT